MNELTADQKKKLIIDGVMDRFFDYVGETDLDVFEMLGMLAQRVVACSAREMELLCEFAAELDEEDE